METLLVGNTGYLTKETIEIAFASDNVVVCDAGCTAHKDKNIYFFSQPIMGDKFKRIFDTYSFERVVFFSYTLNKFSEQVGEIEELRRVFSLSQQHGVKQFVFLVSDEALVDYTNSDSIIFNSTDSICRYYAENYRLEVKIVHSPYLLCPSYQNDYWCRVLKKVEDKEIVDLMALENETAYFLKVSDLMEFIARLFDSWEYLNGTSGLSQKEPEYFYLKSGAVTTYGEIRHTIKEFYPDAKVMLSQSGIKGKIEHGEDKAREKLGWFARHDACWDFDVYIEEYQKNFHIKPSFTEILKKKLKFNGKLLMMIELVGGALLVEVYNYLSGGSVQFRMIDVRLLFVVLMSLIYGTRIGVICALLEIASLFLAYSIEGTDAVMLFYDPSTWIPFILLLVAAAICGYIKQKKEEDFAFIREESEGLRSENAFITQLYKEAMDYKNRYKADLIGSRDGFGRIFDVVKRLSTTVPAEIFAESIPVMEDVLDNKSIAIYTINDPRARFARLNVSSDKISHTLKKSINLDDYSSVLETLKKNDIWFNNEIKEGFPTYVAGIKNEGAVTVLIMIYQVEYLQISTYYSNLIRILSGLMENFIIKAFEYQKAAMETIFIEGTNIAKSDYLAQQFEIQKEMMDNNRTSFRLIRFDIEDRTLTQIDEMFQSKIRNNDIVGLGSDGRVYLIAAQVDENSEGIVLKRFRDMGLKCEVVERLA